MNQINGIVKRAKQLNNLYRVSLCHFASGEEGVGGGGGGTTRNTTASK